MENLKGLYIKWGKIDSTNNILNLNKLEHLFFGSNPRLKSMNGFEYLKNLKFLEIENFHPYADYTGIENITSLVTLKITGTNDKRLPLENLFFLEKLTNLKELILGISLKNKDLSPLKNLKKLEYIWLPTSLEKKYKLLLK